jgi:hypothetical protein
MHDFVSYFVAGEEHYNGKLGGLGETVAESNAIQSVAKPHPFMQMRTHVLQEYFPKTIAFLVKHRL